MMLHRQRMRTIGFDGSSGSQNADTFGQVGKDRRSVLSI